MTFSEYCKQRGWKPCGLNADWSVEAWAVRGPGPYGMIALDNEDDIYSLVWRDPCPVCAIVSMYDGDLEGFIAYCEESTYAF